MPINAGPIITPDQALGQDPNIGLNQQFEREQKERISLRELKERRKTNEADIALKKDQLELNKKKQAVDEMAAVMETYSSFKVLGEDATANAILKANSDAFKLAEDSGIDFSNLRDKSQFIGTALEAVAETDFGSLDEKEREQTKSIFKGMVTYTGPNQELIRKQGIQGLQLLNESLQEKKDTRSTKEKGFATIARIGIEAFKEKTNEYEAFKQAKGDQRFKDQLAAQLMQAELQFTDDPVEAKIKVNTILREIFGDTSGTEEISIDDLR